MATSVREELTYQTVRCGIFPFLKKRQEKKNHIVRRHQKNDANVGKGLSGVGLVNLLSGMAKMFGSKDCTLFL